MSEEHYTSDIKLEKTWVVIKYHCPNCKALHYTILDFTTHEAIDVRKWLEKEKLTKGGIVT